ncbi:MAG: aminotransferase class I/II-fold pyridoxal phosphate-dependent enzyme [Caldilinea sp. CFX5]|nr:aminotransferase class I/II-fold pyridoxal phosphate-dependent enzyme [Caldilinea sp. CFX5]
MSTVTVAPGLNQIQPSRIRELANVAFTMEGVYKLQFGESNMPTPQYIKDAATQAINDGWTFYSENAGLPALRESIARKYAALHNVALDPMHEIVVTASGVQALNLTIRCTLDPGDEALILSPNWPNGTEIVRMFGATPHEIPFVVRDNRFAIDFAALEAALTPKTRLLLYTSPSNPLGWVATVEEQQQLLDFARRHGLWLLADEVYERIYYQGTAAPSILRLCTRDDAVIVAQSFSKSYCMTGWRLGWAVGRSDLIAKAGPLNEFIVSHAATFIQRAALAALEQGEDEIAARAELFHERMSFCYNALAATKGVTVPKPEGAFYLFPRVDGVTDSFAFCLALLKETKVAVAPGVAFGAGGEGALRVCTASDLSILEPATERLCRFIERG